MSPRPLINEMRWPRRDMRKTRPPHAQHRATELRAAEQIPCACITEATAQTALEASDPNMVLTTPSG